MNKEPVAIVMAIQMLCAAILTLVMAFGVELTNEQTAGIMGVVLTLLSLLQLVARKFAYSRNTVERLLKDSGAPPAGI